MAPFSWVRKLVRHRDDTAYHLYGAVVAQARQSAFYTDFNVPDTVDGRFEMIVLHAVLVFRRLEAIGPHGHTLAQEVFDIMFRDMDESLREMGVGDLSVPKKIKTMARAFYGRADAYLAVLDGDKDKSEGDDLRNVLGRNVFPGDETASASCYKLTAYVEDTVIALGKMTFSDFRAARIAFPDPAHVPNGV